VKPEVSFTEPRISRKAICNKSYLSTLLSISYHTFGPVRDGAKLYLGEGVERMATHIVSATTSADFLRMPSTYYEPLWYVASTSANHEKHVTEQLGLRKVEHFLPLYNSVRRWKDRRVTLAIPLFPGYVFVRLALRDHLQVLQVPGVAKLVGFNGLPAALPQEEIDALRTSLASGVRVEPHPYLTAGRRVRVKSGSLAGLEGILVRRKNSTRFVISLDLVMRSVVVEIEGSEVEPI
jgi:transcription antitermination factor NusG